ncbi:hypothetical protein C7999DRAFT_42582 [Corynascus novoguineensis]|uniref:DUF1772-domain-containing protein n=1 Tax=Corynascus novoguineensis TaxID=1126955 RepID=A0AAN7CPZ5_9PEZI|nr:hypothetical protein C7999DRAFT_42582 [Corynascus novoguineensis]
MATHQAAHVRLTQATALLLGTVCAGANLAISFFLVPRLLESPTPVMLRQWERSYRRGAATIPVGAGVAAAAYFYLSFWGPGRGAASLSRVRAYLAAGALTIGIVPYTLLVMARTNGELKRLDAAVGAAAEAAAEVPPEREAVVVAEAERSAKGLVDWWGVLNLGRAGLLLAGSVCGLVATL